MRHMEWRSLKYSYLGWCCNDLDFNIGETKYPPTPTPAGECQHPSKYVIKLKWTRPPLFWIGKSQISSLHPFEVSIPLPQIKVKSITPKTTGFLTKCVLHFYYKIGDPNFNGLSNGVNIKVDGHVGPNWPRVERGNILSASD